MGNSTLGICLGSSSISAVEIRNKDGIIDAGDYLNFPHDGKYQEALNIIFKKFNPSTYSGITLTGQSIRNQINLSSIPEVESLEYALKFFNQDKKRKTQLLASLGAESIIIYKFSPDSDLVSVHSENKCASGTGEFFLQMLQRLDLTTEEAFELARGTEAHHVSGRCSVFCKSDCTHALNAGHSVGSVISGLCKMMAEKISALVIKASTKNKDTDKDSNILVVGGLTKNPVLMKYLREQIPSLEISEYSCCFEALGAALYAQSNNVLKLKSTENLISDSSSKYSRLPALKESLTRVTFQEFKRGKFSPENEYIIGLDVGSTTTKIILLDPNNDNIIASSYLRTHGKPIEAARQCFNDVLDFIGYNPKIRGMGVTGSGRHIVGLFAQTPGIINEIIAHATASAYFDPEVNTIFEIGGQDAKYTYLVNGTPCDYAMNEACSAGTGSFLEEAASETLGIPTKKIAEIALKANNPVNFSDQCSAFISSDIKNAINENIKTPDIIAGLVYSICLNYVNRVKGNRPVGDKVFMQGGVCYNSAVPVAMASILDKDIIVPPDPGLCGAFGVALEIKKRLKSGLIKKNNFNLEELAGRETVEGKDFVCAGGREKCDLKCNIRTLIINNKRFPFGGKCDKYYNLTTGKSGSGKNLVKIREEKLFTYPQVAHSNGKHVKVGMNRTFLTHDFYQFYSSFFTELGCELIIPEKSDIRGRERIGAAYCYPAELAHGFYYDLLEKNPDFIFLPQITELNIPGRKPENFEQQSLCVICQSEPYYLKQAFKNHKNLPEIISPVLNYWKGIKEEEKKFIKIGKKLGFNSGKAKSAFSKALDNQKKWLDWKQSEGRNFLQELEANPDKISIVLFGRSYNAFTDDANMGIPQKITSHNLDVIPYDFLPLDDKPTLEWMHWANGHLLLRGVEFVASHPQLFPVWITNFSCGPDSFLLSWFRKKMKSKPNLIIEIDSHTADAGINTRVDAFHDVLYKYIHQQKTNKHQKIEQKFIPAKIELLETENGPQPQVYTSENKIIKLTDSNVKVLIPPMGDLSSQALTAVFARQGINSQAAEVPTAETLKAGRNVTSCKECLPLILCTGSLMNYLETRNDDEVTIFFMPRADGNCRFGQYSPFIESLISEKEIKNCALLTLSSMDNYAGMGWEFARRSVYAIIISDVMRDIRNILRATAKNKTEALSVFYDIWQELVGHIHNDEEDQLIKSCESAASKLAEIELKNHTENYPVVLLVGEIFQRVDEFSCNHLGEYLAEQGIIMKTAPIYEWLTYVQWLVDKSIIGEDKRRTFKEKLESFLVNRWQYNCERKIKTAFKNTGFYKAEYHSIDELVKQGEKFVSSRLSGETILVTGAALTEIGDSVHGVINIGPFACLPTRLSEALLNTGFTRVNIKTKLNGKVNGHQGNDFLPFISIESDGNPFPPLIISRLEAFIHQTRKFHENMLEEVE